MRMAIGGRQPRLPVQRPAGSKQELAVTARQPATNGGVRKFFDMATDIADDERSRSVLVMPMGAGDKGIEALDAVHQSHLHQFVECPMDL